MADVPRSGPAGSSNGPGSYVPGGYYAGDPYGGGGAGEFSGFDWHRYLMVLRRRMWPALTVFVVVSLVGVLHGFTRIPVFDAKVRLIVDHDRQNVTGLNDPLTQSGIAADYTDVQTQITMLQGRSLARQTLRVLGVLTGPATPSTGGAGAPAPAESGDAPQVSGFLGNLHVAPVPGSRLIDVTYRSTDPTLAAKYVNALAQTFVQQNLESKGSTSKDLTAYLNARMVEQGKVLRASDKALQDYAASHGIATAKSESTLLSQKLSDLAGSYTKAKTDSITKGAIYTQIESLKRDNGPLEDFGPIAQSTVVQQLKAELAAAQKNQAELGQKFYENHPLYKAATDAVKAAEARLHSEVLKAADALQREYQAAQDTEASLGQAVEAQKRDSQATNRSDLELAILQREAESNRTIYDGLVQRLNEFAVTRESQTNNVRIVDAADVPTSPTGDAAGSDMRYGLFGGVVLALLVAFGLERADNRVKTPQQLKELGLTILGLVPKIDLEGTGPLLSTKTPPAFNEAFRGIRTNIRLSIAKDSMRSLVVTSPRAGDGKTAVATNVAVALALSDQRVLLIDADMRRPRVHTVFDLQMQPGLSDLLVGQSKAADTIRRVDVPNLQVLTCGSMPPNPSELLESRRFVEFLERLQKHFDWVIIDAPPILPVTDASIICGHVDGVVFVASAEQTPLPALRGALEQLSKASAHVLGVVLNLVDTQRRGYYYSEYYNRDYNKYYEKSAV